MKAGSSPCAPRYLELTSICAPLCMRTARAEIAAGGTGDARGCAGIVTGKLRDDALHRAAGRELHHDERHQHDPEDGRDHEQDAADDIGAHVLAGLVSRPRCAGAMQLSGIELIASVHDPGLSAPLRLAPRPGESVASNMLSRPLIFRRLVAVIPPSIRDTAEIARLFRRPAEHVPIRDPMGRPCTNAGSNSARRGSRGRARGRR